MNVSLKYEEDSFTAKVQWTRRKSNRAGGSKKCALQPWLIKLFAPDCFLIIFLRVLYGFAVKQFAVQIKRS